MRYDCSWKVQKKMRSILEQMSAGAAGWILDSANPRDKSLTEGCVRCNEDERAQVSQWKPRESVCQKI